MCDLLLLTPFNMTSDLQGKRSPQSALNRKISKGVIERKRRARINRSLAELKYIILSDSKDKGLHSKLDKAEILERTLSVLQNLKTRQDTPMPQNPASHFARYRDGFMACVKEMNCFLTIAGVEEVAKQKITNHLAFCSNGLEHIVQQANLQAAPMSVPVSPSPLPQNFAMVPESPSPAPSGSSTYYGSFSSSPSPKSEPVWRPW